MEWSLLCVFKMHSGREKNTLPSFQGGGGAVLGVEITASTTGGGRNGPTGAGGSEEVVWEALCRLSRGRHYLHLSVIAR